MPTIDKGLEPFECALREIGTGAHFYNIDPSAAHVAGVVQKAHNLRFNIFGIKGETNSSSNTLGFW